MKFLGLFGGNKETPRQQPGATGQAECPHKVLLPRWDKLEDMGHEDKAAGYRCNACGASFTLEEGEEIRRKAHAMTL